VLRACGRVLVPGGRLSFLVITVAHGSSGVNAGPVHAASRDPYPRLLQEAGFAGVVETDVTDDYLATLEAWIREWEAESADLERLVGLDEFAERQIRRRKAAEAIRGGLLQRYLISAVWP